MYAIEDAVEPGYLDEVVAPEKVFEVAMIKAKDLATLAHPQYLQTKKLDQEAIFKKISDGIEKITASSIMP